MYTVTSHSQQDGDMTSPRVAIIVRTKDRPRTLADIAAQTLDDWECVVVNDGGDREELERIVAASPAVARLRVVHHDEPRGMPAAGNTGLEVTTAPYIVLHDDDDT